MKSRTLNNSITAKSKDRDFSFQIHLVDHFALPLISTVGVRNRIFDRKGKIRGHVLAPATFERLSILLDRHF